MNEQLEPQANDEKNAITSPVTNKNEKHTEDPMTVGTLTYTKAGLVMLFFWMLLGAFWFTMMEQLIPQLLPLSLKAFEASNATIGLMVGSLAAVINMIMNPIISFRSDRTRSRFGRRLPYLVVASPFVALFLILIGWTPRFAPLINNWLGWNLSPLQFGLIVICIFVVAFQIFNMFVASVFYYLFADVVPEKYMGRFMSLFMLVGAAAGFCFNRYVIKFADTQMPWIYTVIAITYFASFMAMCWGIKEGEYPEPTDKDECVSFIANFKLYFKECFSISFYRWFFLGTAINAVSTICRSMFNVFFAKENIGLSLEQYGNVLSWGTLVALCLYIPLGYLVDKYRPIKVFIAGITLVVFTNIFGFFLIKDETTFLIFTLLLGVVYAIQASSTLPLYVELLPKDRFGQFCSAQAMAQSIILIIANYGGGLFIDWVGDYRYIYIWDAIFTSVALVAIIIVYRKWQAYGGADNYIAPTNDKPGASSCSTG
jgi:MFS family permease